MKKNIIFFLPFFLILVLSSCKKLERNNPLEGPLTIGVKLGDWGTVAYILQPGDIGYNANVQHGLMVENNTLRKATWGCYGTGISGADGVVLGTGAQNTIDIMNGCSEAGIAARQCGDLVLGGYSDWYLPSIDELNKLYLNRQLIGGFVYTYYWSSTEYNSNYAVLQDFNNGLQLYWYYKNYEYSVRAVRAF